jgi:DNA-binding MarR family transcriptional regulator
MTNKRFQIFVTSITRIWRSMQKLKMDTMSPYGLRSTHVICIFFLRQADDGLTAAELSAQSELDKGAVSRAVAELESLGYVVCGAPDSKRKYRAKIKLTDTGLDVSQILSCLIYDAVEKAGDGISEEDREVFYKVLATVSNNLNKLTEEKIN